MKYILGRTGQNKPVVSLNNSNTESVGLSLNDNDSLKTPTALGNTDVTLKTPTVLGSPTKGPLSAGTHVDELVTPKLSLNNFSAPNNQTQAFFGEHEPLLTGIFFSGYYREIFSVFSFCKILLRIINFEILRCILTFDL